MRFINLCFATCLFGLMLFGSGLVNANPTQVNATGVNPPAAPLSMAAHSGDRVSIRGFKGVIEVMPNEQLEEVRVEVLSALLPGSSIPWDVTLRRVGNEIQAHVDGPQSKKQWDEALVGQELPEYHLRVRMPHIPVDINWDEGEVTVTSLNSAIRLVRQKGSTRILAGEGSLRASQQEGTLMVTGRKGSVDLDLYQAKTDISNVEGRMNIENFSGETELKDSEGELVFTSFRGDSRIANVKGRLQFDNGNSPLHIERFDGEVRGNSKQGAVHVNVVGRANVRVQSETGPVHLRLAGSGAWVNVGSREGDLHVPNNLKLTRLPSQQIRTGRLPGSGGGSVFVRTGSGDVRIR